MITTVLLVFAFVLFVIGTFFGPWVVSTNPWPQRFNFVSAGLAFWVASILFK